jgi:cytochrome c551/c552
MKSCLLLALCLAATLAQAGGAVSRLQMDQCRDCHVLDKWKVGPSFLAVAKRYKDDPEAPDFLAYNIQHGVRGKWGGKAAHPKLGISKKEARRYAEWILARVAKSSLLGAEPKSDENAHRP